MQIPLATLSACPGCLVLIRDELEESPSVALPGGEGLGHPQHTLRGRGCSSAVLLLTLSGTSADPVLGAVWPLGSNISAAVPGV